LGKVSHEGGQERWYKWKLNTPVIQEWIMGTRPNNGLMIWGKAPGKAVSFTSKDSTAAERRPILRLTLSLPGADVAKLGGLVASDITWPRFVADCGKKAQEANEARTEQIFEEQYVGRVVNWTGNVFSSSRRQIGSGYHLNIRMEPSESAFGFYDLTLLASEAHKEKVLSLNKGQRVDFTCRFTRQGGTILGHQLELLSIDPAKLSAQPEPGRPR
jgi:hypothetical protein